MTDPVYFGSTAPTLCATPSAFPPRKRRKTSMSSWVMPMDCHELNFDEVLFGGLASCSNCQRMMTDVGSSLQQVNHRRCHVDRGDDSRDAGSGDVSPMSNHPPRTGRPDHVFERWHFGQGVPDNDQQHAAATTMYPSLGVSLVDSHAARHHSGLDEVPVPTPTLRRPYDSVTMPSSDSFSRTLFELPTSIDFASGLDAAIPTFQTTSASFPTDDHTSSDFSNVPITSHSFPSLGTGQLYTFAPEEILNVDDPLRNYDVAAFIDKWRMRSTEDRTAPFFRFGRRSEMKDIRRPECVLRRGTSTNVSDAQGIEWDVLGPTAKEAAEARAFFHPSKYTFESRTSGKAYLTPSLDLAADERRYQFRSFATRHRARINHYQLRNNVAAASRNDVFYISQGSIMRASLGCPTYAQRVIDFTASTPELKPSCLAVLSNATRGHSHSHTILVAGDINGGYTVQNATLQDAHTEGIVSYAEDGLVTHVEAFHDRRSGLANAAFSTNDGQLRVMDLRTCQITLSTRSDESINCSAISPDGRLRVLVSDHNDVSLTDAERGTTLLSLRHHTDFSFACAWSPDDRHMATGAQDGTVAIWDARNWSYPVHVRQTHMSSASSLRFADNGDLFVAESDDIVSVYDPRRGGGFERTQDVHFFGAIAGIALIDGGQEFVVANADQTVGGLLAYERVASADSSSAASNGPYRGRKRDRRGHFDVELDLGCP